jgi:hypothetical protein
MDILHALRGHHQAPAGKTAKPVMLLAGATGTLGNAVLQRLAGSVRHPLVRVLAKESIKPALSSVEIAICVSETIANWPLCRADTAVVMFDPPRLHYQRERALWTPEPQQLPALAAWMQRCGVQTLAVVLPHDQGRLPLALQQGLANLDEQAVAALGFERLLIVRSAVKPATQKAISLLQRIADGVLSTLAYMVPSSQMTVRASKVAELVDMALRYLPPGIHIAPPELVWRCSQTQVEPLVREWLGAK